MPPRSWVHSFGVGSGEASKESPFFAPEAADINLSALFAKTLVVPIVSAANVPQLAADILITSLEFSRLGTFGAQYHVPVVGAREGDQIGVTTPLELYGKDGVDFVFMQQRSPVLKAQKDKFISSLLEFAKDSGFKALLFVSGVDSTNRTDSQMHTPMYHLFPSTSHPPVGSPLSFLTSLPRYSARNAPGNGPSMPGGGVTRRVLESIPQDWTADIGFLIWMGMEGDNRDDATLVANAICRMLYTGEQIKEWRQPESWRQGLFGTPNDQTLFG